MNNEKYCMYLIVDTSLKMGKGKIAAQVGHGAQLMTEMLIEFMPFMYDEWKNKNNYKKIVLKKPNDMSFYDTFEIDIAGKTNILENPDAFIFNLIVKDAGFTQIKKGSETVLVLFGKEELLQKLLEDYKLL